MTVQAQDMTEPTLIHANETSPSYRGWRVVVACFFLAVFSWGFGFYGHSVYLAELQRLHGWPASAIATATTVYYLLGAVLVIFVSDAVQRLGPRVCVLTGIAAMAVAVLGVAYASELWQLFAAYLIMALGWAFMTVAAISNILGLWFSARRGLAISLALNGASTGGIVVAPALLWLSGTVGFGNGLRLGVAAMVVILVPMALAWIDRPPDVRRHPGPTGAKPATAESANWTRAQALRSLAFWTVAGPFALALLAQVGFIVHMIAYLAPVIGRGQAGVAVAVTTVMAVIGRVGLGTVIDRLDQRRVTAVSLLSQAGALFAMTQSTEPTVLLAACAVFGFSVGNLITLPSLIIQREFDAASFGMLSALVTAICQFSYALGPGLVGVVYDLSGGYTVGLALCMALEIIAAGIVLIRRKAV